MSVGIQDGKFYSDWRDANGVRRRKSFPTRTAAIAHQTSVAEKFVVFRLAKQIGDHIEAMRLEKRERLKLQRECARAIAASAEGKKLPVSITGPVQERLAI